MRWWLFARHAATTARNYVVSSSPPIFPIPLSIPQPPSSTLLSHFRFFSQITDPPLILNQNDVVLDRIDYVGVTEVEEKPHEINAEVFHNIEALLQNDGDLLDSSLDIIGFTLNHDFVIRLIQSSNVLGYNLIRFVKWALNEEKNSFDVSVTLVESLVSKICSGGGVLREKEIYCLWEFLNYVAEKKSGDDDGFRVNVLNTQILNELISSFSKLGKGRSAHEVFDKFELFRCVPDSDSYYFTIEALCRRKDFDQAWSVCRKMIDSKRLSDDGGKVGKIISWFCKGERVKQAHVVYLAAKEKGMHVAMDSVHFLIDKLCQQSETVRLNGKPVSRKLKLVGKSCEENENVKLALEMLNDIPSEGKKYAMKPFSAVIQALSRIKDVDAAKELILKMIVEGPPPGNGVFNFAITEYARAGQMVQAMEMLRIFESRGLKPDLYTYAVLMSGYSNGREMKEARKVLKEAKRKHDKLTPIIYHTLIRGYCKLEQFDEALKLLSEMKDFGVHPNVDEYEKLIQSLCLKALDWETAEKLQEEMKENGLQLKGISRALIRAVKEMEKEVVIDGDTSSEA